MDRNVFPLSDASKNIVGIQSKFHTMPVLELFSFLFQLT